MLRSIALTVLLAAVIPLAAQTFNPDRIIGRWRPLLTDSFKGEYPGVAQFEVIADKPHALRPESPLKVLGMGEAKVNQVIAKKRLLQLNHHVLISFAKDDKNPVSVPVRYLATSVNGHDVIAAFATHAKAGITNHFFFEVREEWSGSLTLDLKKVAIFKPGGSRPSYVTRAVYKKNEWLKAQREEAQEGVDGF